MAETQNKKTEFPLEIPLDKRLVTSEPAAMVGNNYRSLVNLRYRDKHLRAVRGMSKINTTPLSGAIKSGHQLKKDQYSESHVLVQVENEAGTSADIYDNSTSVPGVGDFGTVVYTEDEDFNRARFSNAPDGNIIVCDGAETLIWGGNEVEVRGFINYDPNGTFSYDFTDIISNTKQDADNTATVSVTDGGLDSDTKLLLHMDGSAVDSSGQGHVPVSHGVTWDTANKMFGTASAGFEVGGAIEIPDHADWAVTDGTWAVDCRVYQDTLASGTIMYQGTNANNYHRLSITDSGGVDYVVQASGSPVVEVSAPGGSITAGTWAHIELSENGNSYYLFVDGIQKGHTSDKNRPANYTGNLIVGADDTAGTSVIVGNVDEFRISSVSRHTAKFEPQGSAYSSTPYAPFYLGSSRPIQGFKIYNKTANTTAGEMVVEYWDGDSFSAVNNLSDGTSSGGVSFAQTGSVTFDSTVGNAKLKEINGVFLYWYRMSVSSADTTTQIYHITVDAPMQPIGDIWDGVYREVMAFQWYDNAWNEYTANVYENEYDSSDDATRVDIGRLDTDEYFVCGFSERITGINFSLVGETGNETANTNLTVEYWNGSEWTSVGAAGDGTSEGGISFAQSGTVTWNSPDIGSEFQKEVSKKVSLYYYKFSFDKKLSADVFIYYVAGIPAPKEMGGYSYPLFAHDVVWLLDEVAGQRNSARCSAYGAPEVWNGDDAIEEPFGNDNRLVGGCALFTRIGSSFYNMTLFLKEDEIWAIVGTDPEEWQKYRVSESVGCTAPGTIVSASIGYEIKGSLNRHVALWQARDGIYLFDGSVPSRISDDIENYFDPNRPECINASLTEDSVAFFDQNRLEYHWLFASGSDATGLNKEFVFDLKRMKWFEIDRTTGLELQCGFPVADTAAGAYTYGCANGTMYRLENGQQFDDQDMTCTLWFGDMAIHKGSIMNETAIRNVKMVALAKSEDADVTVTHYRNSRTAGNQFKTPISLNESGVAIAQPTRSLEGRGGDTFHSFKFEITSNADELAFEPLYVGVIYKILRADR